MFVYETDFGTIVYTPPVQSRSWLKVPRSVKLHIKFGEREMYLYEVSTRMRKRDPEQVEENINSILLPPHLFVKKRYRKTLSSGLYFTVYSQFFQMVRTWDKKAESYQFRFR